MTTAALRASPAPPQVLLAHYLRQLKFPTLLREYEKVAAEAAREGLDHVCFLLRLADLELIDRERRMLERRIRAARFPAVKSFDTLDFAVTPSLNKPLALDPLSLSANHEDLGRLARRAVRFAPRSVVQLFARRQGGLAHWRRAFFLKLTPSRRRKLHRVSQDTATPRSRNSERSACDVGSGFSAKLRSPSRR